MSRYKPTKHALARAETRLDLLNKHSSRYLKSAINHGRSLGEYTGDFREYLLQLKYAKHSKSISIKVYNNTIIVYNKRSGRIITTYKVPSRFLPTKEHLHKSIYNRRYKNENSRNNIK